MGSVWSAHDLVGGVDVAIKLMISGLVAQLETRKRFIKEALLARTMLHEGIVRIYGVQEGDGELLIIMERLYGQNLGQVMKEYSERKMQMPVMDALDIIRQVGDVLSYLHRQNVFHCDINRIMSG